MLPIGIVIPTKNVAPLLTDQRCGHMAQLRSLLEHVTEAVVVDSSDDGTVALLREGLSGLRVRFLSHPPGLYQSWNHGISQVTAPYVYISTAGDSIDHQGLHHLYETITGLEADLVISPPRFVDETGQPLPEKSWPIHDLLKRRVIRQPLVLDPCEAFVLQVLEAPKALIGSSAANLYKTEVLRRFPFPTSYGHFGDVAWGIQHAFETRLAITSVSVSQFVVEEKGRTIPIETIESERAKLLALAMNIMNRVGSSAGALCPASAMSMLARLPEVTAARWKSQQAYDSHRRGIVPWILKPAAWKMRRARKSQQRILAALRRDLLHEISSGSAASKPS
jgi:hypothetical protein